MRGKKETTRSMQPLGIRRLKWSWIPLESFWPSWMLVIALQVGGSSEYIHVYGSVSCSVVLYAGLTYFRTALLREGGGSTLIEAYLQRQPSCELMLAPLQWERDRQTHGTVSEPSLCIYSVVYNH